MSGFTANDIIVIGKCYQIIHPNELNKKRYKKCKISKKFYMKDVKSGVDIVNKFTNKYAVVKLLHILKCGFTMNYVTTNNPSYGMSIEEIKNFILENCQYVLPVNVVTNNPVLWVILKYIFSCYIDIADWKTIPLECSVNKKGLPKVMIWNVCDQINKNNPLNINLLNEFITNYPKYTHNYITFQKKHIYITQAKFSLDKNDEQELGINNHPPYSFMSKKFGDGNCHDQGKHEWVVNLFLSENMRKDDISQSLSYLKRREFVVLYT